MNRQDAVNKLCCLVLDIPNWVGNTEEYVLQKTGKQLKDLSEDEITDLLMNLV